MKCSDYGPWFLNSANGKKPAIMTIVVLTLALFGSTAQGVNANIAPVAVAAIFTMIQQILTQF